MSEPDQRSFLSRIRAALPEMHPSERRLAEVVLNFPGELASYSATELARLSNVSNATVTRFVRKIGYGSFEEARQAARAGYRSGAALFRVSPGPDEAEPALAAHVAQGRANLEASFAAIPQAEIDAVARAMLTAPRVWIIGFRTAQSFALYLGAQVVQVVPSVTVLPSAGQTLGETIASIGPEDCAVVFALRRPVRPLPRIVSEIAATGARLAVITDGALPDSHPATWRFRVQTAAPGPLFNHVAVLALAHLMATRTIELAGAAGRRRLSVIEAAHDSLDEI